MIVALVLAVIALSGGFGMFAAFRVNHDPLARLPAATTPMQLVTRDPVPQALSFASEQSFGSRFELNEALIAITTAALSARNSSGPDAVEPPSAVATASPAADDEPPQSAASAPVPETAAIETPNDQVAPAETATEAVQPEIAAPAVASPAAAAASADQQDTARKVAKQRRVAALRRARRARATAVAQSAIQNTAFPQPTVQPVSPAIGGPFVSPPSAKRAQK
jgi:hypothetical protein